MQANDQANQLVKVNRHSVKGLEAMNKQVTMNFIVLATKVNSSYSNAHKVIAVLNSWAVESTTEGSLSVSASNHCPLKQ